MTTRSSLLAWRVPRTGAWWVQSTGSQRAGHKGSDLALTQSVQGAPADRRRQEQSRKGKGVGTAGQPGPHKDERGDALSAVRAFWDTWCTVSPEFLEKASPVARGNQLREQRSEQPPIPAFLNFLNPALPSRGPLPQIASLQLALAPGAVRTPMSPECITGHSFD